jgi:hypothetical protein
MYNDFKEIAKQPALLASIAGFINPVTACIGIAGLVIYAVIKSTSKKEPLPTAAKPLPNGSPTVKATVPPLTKLLTPTVKATVNEPLNNDEIIKKEMIRQAMSELGKRSGKSRARKREFGIETEIL